MVFWDFWPLLVWKVLNTPLLMQQRRHLNTVIISTYKREVGLLISSSVKESTSSGFSSLYMLSIYATQRDRLHKLSLLNHHQLHGLGLLTCSDRQVSRIIFPSLLWLISSSSSFRAVVKQLPRNSISLTFLKYALISSVGILLLSLLG
jgi:hypothetical protein